MTAPKTAPSADDETAAPTPPRGASTYRCANPECLHLDVMHDLPKNKTVRTACSVSTGPRAARCTCTTYIPKETSR